MSYHHYNFSTSLKVEQQNQPRADAFYRSKGGTSIKRYDYNNPSQKRFQQMGIDCSVEYYVPGLDVFWLNYSEKFRTWETGDMCIELWSDYYDHMEGWGLHDESDIILYATPDYFYEVTNNGCFKDMVKSLANEWGWNRLKEFADNRDCIRQLVRSKEGYDYQLIKTFSQKDGKKWMGVCVCVPWEVLINEFGVNVRRYDKNHKLSPFTSVHGDPEVCDFIKHFRNPGTIDVFTNGCCYWFAKILAERFDGMIMYNPIDNHFATYIKNILYDITGRIKMDNEWVDWDEYKLIDPLDSRRVIKYCINKTE